MAESFAVNASPLILLAQADLLHLLQLVAPTGVVPRTVMQELEAGADIDDAAGVVRRASWLTVVDDPPLPDSIALWDLGPGGSPPCWPGHWRKAAKPSSMTYRLGDVLPRSEYRFVVSSASSLPANSAASSPQPDP